MSRRTPLPASLVDTGCTQTPFRQLLHWPSLLSSPTGREHTRSPNSQTVTCPTTTVVLYENSPGTQTLPSPRNLTNEIQKITDEERSDACRTKVPKSWEVETRRSHSDSVGLAQDLAVQEASILVVPLGYTFLMMERNYRGFSQLSDGLAPALFRVPMREFVFILLPTPLHAVVQGEDDRIPCDGCPRCSMSVLIQ